MRTRPRAVVALLTLPLLALAACGGGSAALKSTPAPATRVVEVADTYHGVQVADPFRWLEDWGNPEVKAWSDTQDRAARTYLGHLPGVTSIRARVKSLLSATTVTYWSIQQAGGRVFAKKRQPPRQQPFLVVRSGLQAGDGERVLVDPGVIDAKGTTAIDWYVASPDGKVVAVSLSVGGTESGDLHFFDTASGKQLYEVIPRVNGGTAGGALAFTPDGKGVYYTRYPREGERPAEDLDFWVELWFHALGTPVSDDRYELGKGLPRIAEYRLEVQPGTGRVLCTVQDGDGGEFAHHLRGSDGAWTQLSTFGDKTLAGTFGADEDLYMLSRAAAPRGKVVRVPLSNLDVSQGAVVVPQSEHTIVEDFWGPPTILPTDDRLYVLYQKGGPSEIRVFTLDGRPLSGPRQPEVAAVGGMTLFEDGSLLYSTRSYLAPTTWHHHDPTLDTTSETGLSSASPASFSDVTVSREMATSKDGTPIPVNILRPTSAPEDKAACLLYGYGGYGVNVVPRFRVQNRVLFDQGVIYAVANIRGGGEFGEAWHREGSLTRKQNVFDDFYAALTHLTSTGRCDAERMGIIGGSNGGLLMGATMTQHPEAPKVVVSFVGIYDMLRVELSPNGAFNIPEFGTVKDPAHFKALHAYSPYHNVGAAPYPPTLFLTGANDPRVDPMQSRKMTARLQAATTGPQPILLRTSLDSGHGGQTSLDERIAQWTDVFAFVFHHLRVTVQP